MTWQNKKFRRREGSQHVGEASIDWVVGEAVVFTFKKYIDQSIEEQRLEFAEEADKAKERYLVEIEEETEDDAFLNMMNDPARKTPLRLGHKKSVDIEHLIHTSKILPNGKEEWDFDGKKYYPETNRILVGRDEKKKRNIFATGGAGIILKEAS
jgi:hypothetical protein